MNPPSALSRGSWETSDAGSPGFSVQTIPDDICRRWRSVTPSYELPASDGTYEILIPNMTGTSAGTGRTVASETSSGPNCDAADPTDVTHNIEGHISTSILTVKGVVGENPRSLAGNARVTIEGLPDHVYSVSWTLEQ